MSKVKKLYDILSAKYDFGDYDAFASAMDEETKRRKIYDIASEQFDFGDYDSFSSNLGYTPSAPSAEEIAEEMQPKDVITPQATPEEIAQIENFNNADIFPQMQDTNLPFRTIEEKKESARIEEQIAAEEAALAAYREVERKRLHEDGTIQRMENAKREARRRKLGNLGLMMLNGAGSATSVTGGNMGVELPEGVDIEQVAEEHRQNKLLHQRLDETLDMVRQGDINAEGSLGIGDATRGAWDSATRLSTWDVGISETLNALTYYDLVKKWEENPESLTATENALLDAIAETEYVNSLYSGQTGFWYGVGQSLPQSAAFMGETMLNPANALGQTAMKKVVRELGKRGVSAAARRGAGITTRVVGDIAEAAIGTATTRAGHVIGGAIDRNLGSMDFRVDNNGYVHYEGQEDDGVGGWEAMSKEFGAQFLGGYSEKIGATLIDPALDVLRGVTKGAVTFERLDKFVDALNNTKASKLMNGISNLRKKAHLDSTLAEILEEEFDMLMNARFIGDNNFGDPSDPNSVFNLRNQLTTIASTALTMFGINAVESAGNYANKRTWEKQVTEFDKAAGKLYGDGWEALRESIDMKSPQEVVDELTGIFMNQDVTLAQKRAIMNYAMGRIGLQSYNVMDKKVRDELYFEKRNALDAYEAGRHAQLPQYYNIGQEYRKSEAAINERENAEEIWDAIRLMNNMDENERQNIMRDFSEEDQDLIRNWRYNAYRWQGAIDHRTEQVEDLVDEYAGQVNPHTRPDGTVTTAILGDNVVYVIDEAENGDAVVETYDGYPRFCKMSDLEHVQQYNAEELIERFRQNTTAVVNQETEKNLSYPSEVQEPAQGVTVETLDGKQWQVAATDGENVEIVGLVFDKKSGQWIPNAGDYRKMTREQFMGWQKAELDRKKANTYEQGDELTFYVGGEPISAEITGIDPDGNYYVRVSNLVEGLDKAVSDVYTAEELRKLTTPSSKVSEKTTENESTPSEKIKQSVSEEVTDSQIGENVTEPAAEVAESVNTALSRVPKDAKGNPLYEQTDADTAWDAIMEQTEGDAEMAQRIAEEMVADKKAALTKMQKGKPNKGATVAEKIANEKAHIAAIAQAEAEVAAWEKIAQTEARRREAAMSEADRYAAEMEQKNISEGLNALGEPQSLQEYVLAQLAGGAYKLRWNDKENGTKGFSSHTGLSTEEMKARLSMIDNKNGLTPEEIAHSIVENMDASFGEVDVMDVTDMVIDAVSTYASRRAMLNGMVESRAELLRQQEIAEQEAKDAWYMEQYHATEEELSAYSEYLSEITEEIIADDANYEERFNTFAELIADEYDNQGTDADIRSSADQGERLASDREGSSSVGEGEETDRQGAVLGDAPRFTEAEDGRAGSSVSAEPDVDADAERDYREHLSSVIYEIESELGALTADNAETYVKSLFDNFKWQTLEEANDALRQIFQLQNGKVNSLAILPYLDAAQKEARKLSHGLKTDRKTLSNGDVVITNYDSNGKLSAVTIERDGEVVSVGTYEDGALFERTDYDANGNATKVARYKDGEVVSEQEYKDGKRKVTANVFDMAEEAQKKRKSKKKSNDKLAEKNHQQKENRSETRGVGNRPQLQDASSYESFVERVAEYLQRSYQETELSEEVANIIRDFNKGKTIIARTEQEKKLLNMLRVMTNKDIEWLLSELQTKRDALADEERKAYDDAVTLVSRYRGRGEHNAVVRALTGANLREKLPLTKIDELFEKYNSDADVAELYRRVRAIAEQIGLDFWFDDNMIDAQTGGFRKEDNRVRLNAHMLYSSFVSDQEKATTIVHEILHAVADYAIETQRDIKLGLTPNVQLSKQVLSAANTILNIYEKAVKGNPLLVHEEYDYATGQMRAIPDYGTTSAREMLMEISNPEFRDKLMQIEYKKRSVWQWIVDTLKSMFTQSSDVTNPTAYDSMAKALDVLINEFSMDAYQKYSGLGEDALFIGQLGAESLDRAEEATTRLDNLKVAREMEAAEKDAKTIKMATGWERGADGKWRYEVEDFDKFDVEGLVELSKRQPRLYKDYQRYKELLHKRNALLMNGGELSAAELEEYDKIGAFFHGGLRINSDGLSNYIDDEELFRAYPKLANVIVKFVKMEGADGGFNKRHNTIYINSSLSTEEKKRSLVHEVQHAIQDIEGFSSGGTLSVGNEEIESFKAELGIEGPISIGVIKQGFEDGLATPEQISVLEKRASKLGVSKEKYLELLNPYNFYNNISGEVEARNVESRMGMTLEERRASLAAETEDVAREDQIFLYDAVESASMVYHGSGALFDKFDHSFMGTGEGNQAFGWGTYVSEAEGVGKTYAKIASKPMLTYKGQEMNVDGYENPWRVIKDLYDMTRGKISQMRADAEKYERLAEDDSPFKPVWGEIIDILKNARRGDIKVAPRRVLYSVEIPDDNGSNYLMWYENVPKEALTKAKAKLYDILVEGDYKGAERELKRELDDLFALEQTGQNLYGNISAYIGSDKEASQFLNEMGYVGIKYPTNTLHGGNIDGTNNYVIFDENDLEIVDNIRFRDGERFYQGLSNNEIFDALNEHTQYYGGGPSRLMQALEEYYKGEIVSASHNAGIAMSEGLVPVPDKKYAGIEGEYHHIEFRGEDGETFVEAVPFAKAEDVEKIYGILFRDGAPFFSNAERAVENIKQEKATPEQWLAMIKKDGGLKAGEDKWMGLSDWLNEQKAEGVKTLTKDEVLAFIRENQIEIEEVNYAQSHDYGYDEDYNAIAEEIDDAWDDYVYEAQRGLVSYGQYRELDDVPMEQVQYHVREKIKDIYGDDIFDHIEIDEDGNVFVLGDTKPINSTRLDYTTEGLDNKREIALVVPTIEPWNQTDTIHFGDAGDGRAVAWVRFGETTTPREEKYVREVKLGEPYKNFSGDDVYPSTESKKDYIVHKTLRDGTKKFVPQVNERPIGDTMETAAFDTLEEAREAMSAYYKEHPLTNVVNERVLVIDEVQSKRHDEGRAKGYKSEARLKELDREYDKLIRERAALTKEITASEGVYNNETMRLRAELGLVGSDEQVARYREIDERLYEVSSEQRRLRNAIPDAPFDKNYHELAMKRMLRYAAENGFDKVAWNTGKQVAQRFGINKVVDTIECDKVGKNGAKSYTLKGLDYKVVVNQEGTVVAGQQDFVGKMLSDIVGKPIADKMLQLNEGESIDNAGLTIGGEDRNALYDEMIPRFMNKYTKKWGTKVGEVTLPEVEEAGRTMWSVDVTPEMRESVMQGQPMFREGMGAISDREVSYENDPIAKWQGKPRYYGKRAAAFAERERARMQKGAEEAAKILGIEVEIITDASTLKGRKAKAKGWYDINSKKVVVVVPNHVSKGDAVRTVLHEGVAHHGLRELFGDGFDAMLDNIYNNVAPELKARIDAIAERTGVSTSVATEEYLASLAEETNFEEAKQMGWWVKIKGYFMKMLRKLSMPGITLREEITDNELRYLLWRSYQNLVDPNSFLKPLGYLDDVAKQKELKVGEYAENTMATPRAAEMSEAEEWSAITMQRIEELEAQMTQLDSEIAEMEADRDADDESRYDIWEQQIDPLRKQLEDVYAEIEGLYNLEAEDEDIEAYKEEREATLKLAEPVTYDDNKRIIPLSQRFDKETDDIRYRLVEDQAETISEVEREVEREAAALGVPVRIARSVDELPDEDTRKRAVDGQLKGYFDPRTGEVVVYEPNTDNANDAKRTVLHETVGHKGLRQLIGEQRYDKAMVQLMYMLPSEVRDAVLRRAERHGWNAAIAMDEYLADQAERDVQPTWWGKVNAKIRALLRNMGFNVMLTDADVTYLLWRSRKKLMGDTAFDMATDAILKQAARKSVDYDAESDNAIRHRGVEQGKKISEAVSDYYEKYTATTNADKFLGGVKYMATHLGDGGTRALLNDLSESQFEDIRSVRVLEEAIESAEGKPLRENEMVHKSLNAKTSRDARDMDKSQARYFQPMAKLLGKILGKKIDGRKIEIDDVERYLICKHSPENNEFLMKRAHAENRRKKIHERAKELMKGTMTEEEAIAQATSEYTLHQSDFRDDYSGLTELFPDEMVREAKITERTEELTSNGVDEDTARHKASEEFESYKPTLEDREKMAADEVARFEAAVDGLHEELWGIINGINRDTIERLFRSGLISRSLYNDLKKRHKFYVPLSGWKNDAAADIYNYAMYGFDGTPIQTVIKKAFGTKYQARNILGSMFAMNMAAITEGNQNLVKQKLYNLALNHDTGVLQIVDLWEVKDGEGDASEWKPAPKPELRPTMSDAEMQKALTDYQNKLMEMEKDGKARKAVNSLADNFGKHTTDKEAKRHHVELLVNGRKVVIWVNGNPKLAQAINGDLKVKKELLFFDGAVDKANRFLAQVQTSLNPEFMISNFERDILSASRYNLIKYGPKYEASFMKHLAQLMPIVSETNADMRSDVWGGAGIFNLFALDRNTNNPNRKPDAQVLDMNNPLHREFVNFLNYGGKTGYVERKQAEDLQQRIKKLSEREQSIIRKVPAEVAGWAVDTIEQLNEGIENATRFAAYLTARERGKSVTEAVFEAKEVSVNFNMQGSGAWGNASYRKLYNYFNVGLQALRREKNLGREFPKAYIANLAFMMALGAISTALLTADWDGDDEDEYMGLSDFNRYNYINVKTENGFIHYSLPQDLRAFYAIGCISTEWAMGKIDGSRAVKAYATQANNYTPLSFVSTTIDREPDSNPLKNLAMSFVPSAAVQGAEIAVNEDFLGRRIHNQNQWNEYEPEWQRAGYRTPEWVINASKALSEAGGGTEHKRGVWFTEINPSNAWHVMDSYGGGFLDFAQKTYNLVEREFAGKEHELRDYPMVSKFYVESGQDYSKQRVVNDRYRMYREDYETIDNELNGYLKDKSNALRKLSVRAKEEGLPKSVVNKERAEIEKVYSENVKRVSESPNYWIYETFAPYEKGYNKLNSNLGKARKYGSEQTEKELSGEMYNVRKKLVDEIDAKRERPIDRVRQWLGN